MRPDITRRLQSRRRPTSFLLPSLLHHHHHDHPRRHRQPSELHGVKNDEGAAVQRGACAAEQTLLVLTFVHVAAQAVPGEGRANS